MIGLQLEGDALEARAQRMFELGQRLVSMVPTRMTELDQATTDVAKGIFEQLVEGIDELYPTASEETIPGRLRELGFELAEARGVVGMLLMAGTETTSTAFARIVGLLLDTDQWEQLAQDRDLLTRAIEEGLRMATPVPASTRTTARDGSFRGRKLKGGRLVLIAWARAVRDAGVIDDGTTFDITREQPRELRLIWFGAGPHFCLGYNLAMRELALSLTALLDGAPKLELVHRRAARRVLLPTWEQLLVRQAGAGAGAGAGTAS